MSEKISSRGRHNKKVLAEVLNENGFDSKYLLEWGLPSFWREEYWNYSNYVLDLVAYFEDKYAIYDNRENLEEI